MIIFCLSHFFFNDTATTEIYTYLHTLSLHDALPISASPAGGCARLPRRAGTAPVRARSRRARTARTPPRAGGGRPGSPAPAPASAAARGGRGTGCRSTAPAQGGRARKSVMSGTGESVRVGTGGSRIIKKKNKTIRRKH